MRRVRHRIVLATTAVLFASAAFGSEKLDRALGQIHAVSDAITAARPLIDQVESSTTRIRAKGASGVERPAAFAALRRAAGELVGAHRGGVRFSDYFSAIRRLESERSLVSKNQSGAGLLALDAVDGALSSGRAALRVWDARNDCSSCDRDIDQVADAVVSRGIAVAADAASVASQIMSGDGLRREK